MKVKHILLLLAVLISNITLAQTNSSQEALEKLIKLMEKDYPGFDEKTKDKVAYEYFKNSLLEKSKSTADEDGLKLLNEFTSYFRDKHIFFLDASNSLLVVKTDKKEVVKNPESFLNKIKISKDTLEGIWKNEDFKIGVIKAKDNTYKGFVISSNDKYWQPNDVLFTLDNKKNLKFFNKDLTFFEDTYSLPNQGTLQFTKLKHYFIKDNQDEYSSVIIKDRISKLQGFYIEKVSEKTTLIRLKSFDYPFVQKIESLIADHKTLIENSEYLIVDLRGNGGGTTTAYPPLLPYIVTGKDRSLNNEFLVTDFLISGLEAYIKRLPDTEESQKEKVQLNKNIAFYKQNMGKFVLNPGEKKVEEYNLEPAIHSPKQIIFLVDKKVGSSAEALLLTAKQSKKVKVMGTPTSGVLDYASARITNFKWKENALVLPTYRSLRLPDFPIDNIGVQPDIYLDHGVEDWVKYAIQYLED
ncbi:S41 family peptidase [Pedobacter nototheniae]|uniref:S41 family peptidase n=1 Tax=Pedobacter nototheniae TaxID=2488994 RepID=UPI002931F241|nr:S41 family peptidase [Pedobacter nototheniae]